jgi:hypothetical protein
MILTGCKSTPVATNGALPAYPAPSGDQSPVITNSLPDYNPPIYSPPIIAPADSDIPKSDNGYASIGCIPVYASSNTALPESMKAYLTPGSGDSGDMLYPVVTGPTDKDIVALTDSHGWLLFKNVPPGKYFLIVIHVPGWSVAATSIDQLDTPMSIEVSANEIANLQIVYIP